MRNTKKMTSPRLGLCLSLGILLISCPLGVQAIKATGSCPKELTGGIHMGMNHSGHGESQAQDLGAAGRLSDAECVNCHGVHGISRASDVPNLAGQNGLYLCEWLEGCRSEGKQCESHEDIAGKLTDEDILGLSALYASMPTFSR